jgi:hypothetical protein
MKLGSQPSQPPDPTAGHERSDMSLRVIVKFGIGFVLFITAAHLLIFGLFRVFTAKAPSPVTPLSPPMRSVEAPIVGPQLEVDPSSSWEQMRQAQERMLRETGWVDPKAGIIRIPIERAMELALQRGFPVRAPATQPVPVGMNN